MGKTSVTLFTIGHSNHSVDKFINLLKRHEIECIVDVRSAPYSRYNRHFAKEALSANLAKNNIQYVWLGELLGGRRWIQSANNEKQYNYDDSFREGLVELVRIAGQERTAMMCSEENPDRCHRNHIITQYLLGENGKDILEQSDISILNIRGDESLEPAIEVKTPFKPSLF